MSVKFCRSALLAAVAGALVACNSAPVRIVTDSYQSLVYKSRSKGESESTKPDAVKREFSCSDKKPFELKLEHSELVPPRFKSGREVNHRLIYAACTPRDAVQTYALVRRISRSGKTMFEDRDIAFAVKPGRWVVDSFIGIPAAAPAGIYTLEVVFELRGGARRSLRTEFEVTN